MNIIFNIFVVVLPLAWARRPLTIKLNDLDIREGARVKCYGKDVALLTDDEIMAFGYGEERLKDAFAKLKNGHRPDMLYVSPTGKAKQWFDEYSHICPSPLKRTIRPVSSKIWRVYKIPTMMNEHTLANKSPTGVKYEVKILLTSTSKVQTSWHSAHEAGISASVEVGYKAFSASMSVSYKNSWGKEETKSNSTVIKVQSETSIEVESDKVIKIQTNCSRWIVEVLTVYDVTVSGCVLGTYDDKVDGAYLWFTKIKEFKEIQNKFRTQHVTRIEYHSSMAVRTSNVRSSNY
nr:venom protein U-MPTX.8-11 [Megalopyge opercularis]